MIRRKLRRRLSTLRNVLCISVLLFLIFIYWGSMNVDILPSFPIPRSALKYVSFEEKLSEPLKTSEIKRLINDYNLKERIMNLEIFGPIQTNTVILVIHVHKLTPHLKYLLFSLSQVKGIQDALVIFTHSYYSRNVNMLIRTIDFCRVLQIFYPHSIQLYPDNFPGHQPGDCLYNMDLKTAQDLNCTGAFTPDIHGRYRRPEKSEIKHHWWWTANKVFENLTCTEDHDGIIFFLEDNVYLMEDFLYMALFMKATADKLQQCEFVSLGSTGLPNSKGNKTHFVEVTTWDPVYHSSVVGFDLSVWNNIVSHYDLFCSLDDYSWSRSLFYLSLNRRVGNRFKVMSSVVPRAPKTSDCSFYEHFVSSDVKACVSRILKKQKKIEKILFPPHLEIYTNVELESDAFVMFDVLDNNGGWGDERDQCLCQNITISKIKKILLDMTSQFDAQVI